MQCPRHKTEMVGVSTKYGLRYTCRHHGCDMAAWRDDQRPCSKVIRNLKKRVSEAVQGLVEDRAVLYLETIIEACGVPKFPHPLPQLFAMTMNVLALSESAPEFTEERFIAAVDGAEWILDGKQYEAYLVAQGATEDALKRMATLTTLIHQIESEGRVGSHAIKDNESKKITQIKHSPVEGSRTECFVEAVVWDVPPQGSLYFRYNRISPKVLTTSKLAEMLYELAKLGKVSERVGLDFIAAAELPDEGRMLLGKHYGRFDEHVASISWAPEGRSIRDKTLERKTRNSDPVVRGTTSLHSLRSMERGSGKVRMFYQKSMMLEDVDSFVNVDNMTKATDRYASELYPLLTFRNTNGQWETANPPAVDYTYAFNPRQASMASAFRDSWGSPMSIGMPESAIRGTNPSVPPAPVKPPQAAIVDVTKKRKFDLED